MNVTPISKKWAPIGADASTLQRIDKYFGDRGLTVALLCEKYGMEMVSWAEGTQRLRMAPYPAMGIVCLIPQYDIDGRPYGTHNAVLFPHGRDTYKLSTKGVNNPSFLPVSGGWMNADPAIPIVGFESIVKAIVGAEVTGCLGIGFNGVDGWSMGGARFHRSLENPDYFRGRLFGVLYDSLSTKDPKSRANVIRAQTRVEEMMATWNHCALFKPRLPEVPESVERPKGQWGVDDYVVSQGREALVKLFQEAEVVPYEEASARERMLLDINRQFAVLNHPVRVAPIDSPYQLYSFRDFSNLYRKHTIPQGRVMANGGLRMEHVSVAEAWFAWSQRHDVKKLVWRPGEERLVDGCLNIWGGFGIEPADDVGGAEDGWYGVAIEGLGEKCARLLVNMLAALVQRPSRKIGWYVYLYGKSGTGKNYLLEPVKRIFGQHCVPSSMEGYISKFNSMFSPARVILISELPERVDTRVQHQFEAELKLESDTAPHMRVVEAKGVDRVQVERLCNVFMASNYHPMWHVSRSDRRGLFLEMSEHMREQGDAWWKERQDWMHLEGGAGEVMRFLLDWQVDEALLPAIVPATDYRNRLVGAQGAGSFEDVLDDFLRNRPSELEGVQHLLAEHLIYLALGTGRGDIDRMKQSAGRVIQLKLGEGQRLRVAKWGRVNVYSLTGNWVGADVVESLSKWDKYFKER